MLGFLAVKVLVASNDATPTDAVFDESSDETSNFAGAAKLTT